VGGRTYLDEMILGVFKGTPLMVLMIISLNTDFRGNGWSIRKKRIILSAGNRRDIEQIGASLTTTNDVLVEVCFFSCVFIR
jgi:hypothetical protein